MPVAELFRALGESTRLQMVERLSSGESHTISSVSTGLGISRQAARKHLQILAEADLITLVSSGRTTFVKLELETLRAGKTFIAELENRWDQRLEALRRLVDEDV